MHELALQYMQWQHQTEGLVLNFGFELCFQTTFNMYLSYNRSLPCDCM